MANNLTSVTSLTSLGLRDWLTQRVSAVVLAAYILFLWIFIICHPNMTFAVWQDFFTNPWIRLFSIIFLLSLLVHAWVGMWTIATDYLKITWIRILFETAVIIALICFFVWGVFILYRS